MAPLSVPASAFDPRSVSTDNVINIVFGISASILGILTIIITWRMWRGPTRFDYLGPRDDSKSVYLSARTKLTVQALPSDIELQPIAGSHRYLGGNNLGRR